MDTIIVKVASLGGIVKEVMIAKGASVTDALSAAGVSSDNQEVRVNGRTPCGSLVNGDVITLAPKTKGGR